MNTSQFCLSVVFGLVIFPGCLPSDSGQMNEQEKKARPVEVRLLVNSRPNSQTIVAAPVASWKTEQIGMEVAGRIEWVAEPNTIIEGRVRGEDGQPMIDGTPIARIDSQRYQLQVKSQEAQVEQAKQSITAATIQLEQTLPAQIRAAKSEQKRAQTEYDRAVKLDERNAGSKADVDRTEVALSTANSQLEQLNASVNAQKAQLASLQAQQLQAQDGLLDAQRDLENCTLYSSFRGQIADVAVVPGSVVATGQAVATIQMMDPIKIEVEVSAADSRRLRNRQRIPVLVDIDDNPPRELDGYLYLVDSVADTRTGTFTLTLLALNQQLADESAQTDTATTSQTWRLDFPFLPGGDSGTLYASEDCIYRDEQGDYVWRVVNIKPNGAVPADRLLKVTRMAVQPMDAKVPFLGNWSFRQIIVSDPAFVPKETIIAGRIEVPDGSSDDWEGDTLLFQNKGQWLLRPGDLVSVDLSDSALQSGLFVPMNAIANEADRNYLFLLNEADQTVQKTEVDAQFDPDQTSSMVAVKAVDQGVSIEGRKYVVRGAHYLTDGEVVRAILGEAK